MTNRFTAPIWAEPTIWSRPPTADEIAATGRAFPSGKHDLTANQQQAWFGAIVFSEPVSWDGAAFVSGDRRVTPRQIAAGEY